MTGTAAAPPATAGRIRILLVCTGNVCRSPFAHLLLQQRLTQAGVAASVTSAGTRALVGAPMDPRTADGLAARGVALAAPGQNSFRASDLTAEQVAAADLVLTATVEHRDRALRLAPRALKRCFTLREFAQVAPRVAAATVADLVAGTARARGAAHGPLDIADPVDADPTAYNAVLAEIDEAVAVTTRAVAAAWNGHAGRQA